MKVTNTTNSMLRAVSTSSSGFTLLEVMIALAIIGVALLSLLGLGNRSLHVHDKLQHTTMATLLAQQKMSETEYEFHNSLIPESPVEQGDFSEPFDDYRWERVFSETPLPAVTMVTVRVSWGNPNDNESVDVTSFLFQ